MYNIDNFHFYIGDDDGCSSSVCQNGGTCYFIGAEDNTYCQCPWLYTGDACETGKLLMCELVDLEQGVTISKSVKPHRF